jgi:hypothetical protein
MHRQLSKCRHLSRAERDVLDAKFRMPELRIGDQVLSQYTDIRVADAWRQVQ